MLCNICVGIWKKGTIDLKVIYNHNYKLLIYLFSEKQIGHYTVNIKKHKFHIRNLPNIFLGSRYTTNAHFTLVCIYFLLG